MHKPDPGRPIINTCTDFFKAVNLMLKIYLHKQTFGTKKVTHKCKFLLTFFNICKAIL